MHEYHTTKRLLDVALEQAQLASDERIVNLKINLDPNSGYTPESIRFYFEQLAAETPAAGAVLEFDMLAASQPVQLMAIDIQ
ncbi:MAG: hydrogenase maturation nickel metallochaperone HypA [Caldilineaceae bacterium]